MIDFKFCVYRHTNKINQKVYIGITSQDPNKRWNKGAGYINCTAFYRAIKKYGWNSFEHEILYKGLSNEEALSIETTLIKYYKERNLSYNIKEDSAWIGKNRQHCINVYTLSGNFITTCNSIHEASIKFNVSESGIYYSATKYKNTRYWKNYIFIFSSESIEERLQFITTFKYRKPPNRRKVIRIDPMTKEEVEYATITEAA